MESRVHTCRAGGVNLVQCRSYFFRLRAVQIVSESGSVQFASRDAQSPGRRFGTAEECVGNRHGGLHMTSITLVIPDCRQTAQAALGRKLLSWGWEQSELPITRTIFSWAAVRALRTDGQHLKLVDASLFDEEE